MSAREVLSLYTAQLPVQKTLATNSRISITSKLIQTKALQLLYSGHLRKTGGRGSYRLVHTAHLAVRRGLATKSSYSRTPVLSAFREGYVTHRGVEVYRCSCQTNSPAMAQTPLPPLPYLLPWTHKRHRRRWTQRTPAILQLARSGGEHGGEELLGLVKGDGEAEEVGAAGVGVFFVAGSFARREVCEDVPGRVLRE